MTFAELVTTISRSAFPEGAARVLDTLHTNLVKDALIDLQKKVECLQSQNILEVTAEDTFFYCGASAFEAPDGFIQSLRSIYNLLDTDDWRQCDAVWAKAQTRQEFECLLENAANCGESLTCGFCYPIEMPYDQYYVYGQYYQYPELPYGLMYRDANTGKPCRAQERWFAMFNNHIYTYPVVNPGELLILEWHGVKRNWAASDVFPFIDEAGAPNRQVLEAIEYFVMAEHALRIDCDKDRMVLTRGRYDQLVSELIWQCRKSRRLPNRKHCFVDCSC